MLVPRSPLWATIVACLFPLGCGTDLPEDARPTQPVSVTVTYNGQPIEGAIITFVSEESEPVAAYGRTDANGVARMKTYVEGDGAVIGKHKVTIAKTETTGEEVAEQTAENYDPAELNPNYVPPTVKYIIPQKYMAPDTSGLTAEVTESGPDEIRFDLKD